MLFSYKLLSELVDLHDITPEELAKKLTFAQFEVEGMKKSASATKLVIGHVLTCVPHPDSDHLHCLTVDEGQDGVSKIVCGAPNVAAGQKVIVAQPGCELPAIGETIQRGVIRGQESDGMCCSLSELGVDKAAQSEEDLKGIHVLPADAPIGEHDVLGYLGLDDTLLDISVLPNRPDCLSHFGVAREISSVLDRKLLFKVSAELPETKSSYSVSSSTEGCDKFLLAEVKNLHNGKTPDKVVKYLRSLGLRSVSEIVDLGNWSMILTGQPLHMYDLDKVKGKSLTVRDDVKATVKALNGKEYEVIPSDLIVADEEKPCCLAGVTGLEDVAVDEKTTHIGIEAAHFYHADVRHTSNRLGLFSDSSQLFVKGTNPYIIEEAMNTTLHLLKEFFPEAEIVGLSSYDKTKEDKRSFPFSYEKLNHRLGASYPKEVIDDVLRRTDVTYKDGMVTRNRYRQDLNEQCDIEEEVFRLADQKYIKLSLDKLPVTQGVLSDKQAKLEKIRNLLLDNGLDQIITYTLVNEKMDKSYRVFSDKESYAVLHPLTEDHKYVRSDLLSSMIMALQYNLDHKSEDLGLFEISEINTPHGNFTYLAIGLKGKKKERGSLEEHPYDFYDLKGYFTLIMEALGLNEKRYMLVRSKNPSFHPGRSADALIGKKVVATFGEGNPSSEGKDMYLLEIDLSALIPLKSSRLKMSPLPVFLPIRRDLAFVLDDKNVTGADIEKQIKRAGGKYVQDVQIFDVFTKDEKTSYAFSLELYREDRSFKDEEINELLNTIVLGVTHALKVSLRK